VTVMFKREIIAER